MSLRGYLLPPPHGGRKPSGLMCPEWWLNTALVGSAVRTLTENPGNQGIANRVGTVRTADPTGFHQSGHMSQKCWLMFGDRCREGGRSRVACPRLRGHVQVGQGFANMPTKTWACHPDDPPPLPEHEPQSFQRPEHGATVDPPSPGDVIGRRSGRAVGLGVVVESH